MKRLPAAVAVAAVLIFMQSGCERHAAAETVPGFAEKLADKNATQETQARTPVKVNPDSPAFFPQGQ